MSMRRREFLRGVGAGVVGGALGSRARAGETTTPETLPADLTLKDLPTRKLGRIGIDVPLLSLGTAPMGHAFYRAEPFEEVVNAAIDAGVCYLDTARVYDIAETRLKPILARRRKEVFLVCKAWSKTADGALKSLAKSMEEMGVDHVDLCHLHNVGQFTKEEVFGKGGLLEGVLEARRRGWTTYIGCSGHLRPDRFAPVIETGEIDLVMPVLNFVDCHTYNFEEKVLPVARKHGCAIVAMKVLGGVHTIWSGYRKRESGRLAEPRDHQDAFDYAASIPDLSTMVVGIKSLHELGEAIRAVRGIKPLEGERRERVLARGRELAGEWGDRLGPVSEA